MTDDVELLQSMLHDLALEKPERLTLLDRFAGLAIQGMMANEGYWKATNAVAKDKSRDWGPEMAKHAYSLASCMLKERARRMTKGPSGPR